jgi:hypothetical protein
MLLRAVDRLVRVRALCQAYGVETDRDYIWRQRQGINCARSASRALIHSVRSASAKANVDLA